MSKTAFLEKYGAKKDKKAKKEKKEKKSKKSKTNTGPAKDLAKYESTFHDTDDTFFQPRANEGATNEEDEGDDNDTPWSSMMNINNEDDGPIVVDKSGKVINVPSAAPITTAPVTAAPVAVLSKPARKRIGSDASDDSSPPRRRARADSDASVPRRSRADSSASESSSPPRRRARADSDASAPRRPSASETSSDESDEPPRKKRLTQMASGHSAGLQSGSQFQKKENEIKKEAEVEFSDMMKEGAGQQSTVYRDKSGKKLELSEHLKKQKEVEKQAKLAEEKELKEYRKGAKQKEEEKRRREEMQVRKRVRRERRAKQERQAADRSALAKTR